MTLSKLRSTFCSSVFIILSGCLKSRSRCSQTWRTMTLNRIVYKIWGKYIYFYYWDHGNQSKIIYQEFLSKMNSSALTYKYMDVYLHLFLYSVFTALTDSLNSRFLCFWIRINATLKDSKWWNFFDINHIYLSLSGSNLIHYKRSVKLGISLFSKLNT